MPKADEPNDKALQSLDARLDAFEAKKAAERPAKAASEKANQDGYRLLADLIGGVLVGLGFGWLLDHYVHTAEWEQFEYDRRVTDWELKRGFERS